MKSSLNKYKIGLAIIGIFTLVLFIVVIVQAGGTKQDNQTYKKATQVADKLNTYTQSHPVPSDLSNIGVSDIPSTIAYKRLSDASYKFCVTYKTKSANFSASDVETQLMTGGAASAIDDYSNYSDENQSYLIIDSSHNKGQKCQTITTSYYGGGFYNDFNDSPYSSSSSALDKALNDCDTKYPATSDGSNDQAYEDCVNNAYDKYDSGSNSSGSGSNSSPNTFSN